MQAVKRDKPQIAVTVVSLDQRLLVKVRDNGTGIAPENLGRVFEPFFTTRDVGAGLGLGLSVTQNIVVRHLGGKIGVQSALASGACFVIHVPLVAPANAA